VPAAPVRHPLARGGAAPKCGHGERFDIKSRSLYQCKLCSHQASATSGTVMGKTRPQLVVELAHVLRFSHWTCSGTP